MAVVIAILGGACASDPWAGSPRAPGAAEREEAWTVAVRGRVVAVTQRATGRAAGGAWALDRTTWAWSSGAARTAALVECGAGACTTTRWTTEGAAVTQDGCAPEIWPPSAPTTCRLAGEDRALARDGSRVSWVGPTGPIAVDVDADGRPQRVTAGVVVAERAAGDPPDPVPVDPAELLAVPSDPFPRARRAHVAEFDVGGERVRVEAPTWPELPPERERVRALVDEVADALVPSPTPGARTAAAAVAAGRGDCTEYALVLRERLEREGFRARTAAGRVYVDEPRPALALHAWVEVWLGGRWVAADPALRQFPADATHLRLGEWMADLAANDGEPRLVSAR